MALEETMSPAASEFLTNPLDNINTAIEENKGLDLSGVEQNDQFDLFSHLNLNSIVDDDKVINAKESNQDPSDLTDQPEGPGPGDPPQKTKEQLLAEANRSYRQGLIRGQLYSDNLGAIAYGSVKPLQAVKRYEFPTYLSNIERYQAYGQETFGKLGFNPIADNEKYYNANTSNWQEWKRMFGQFGGIFSSAFTSNYRSIGNTLTGGDGALTLDVAGNDAFAEANRLGASSKGGFTGFAVNLALNSAYSVGIAANIVFEEAVIWGAGALAAPATGGASLGASAAVQTAEAASIASKVSRLKKAMSLATGGAEMASIGKGGYQMLKSLYKLEDAKAFWQGAKMFGKGALNFANPFRQTTTTIRGMMKGESTYRNLTNYAKMSRGFGSFYRDMRENFFTIGEAQMEGAGIQQQRIDENFKYYQEHHNGALPTGKDLEDIYANAYAAGKVDALGNIPLIFFTNRITFDKLFKFRGVGELIEGYEKSAAKGVAREIVFDRVSNTFVRQAPKSIWQNTIGAIKKAPKLITGGGLAYIKENISEGVQELGQEWLSGATNEYYKKLYTDPGVNNAKLLKSSVYDGLVSTVSSKESWESVKKNIFSKQGLETFASGFLMGGLIGGPKRSITALATGTWNKMGEAYMKRNNPQAFEAYQKDKQELIDKHLAIMNNMLSNPENFFNKKYETFHNQKRNAQRMDEADRNKDDKEFHNAKDELTFEHVINSLQDGTFDMVLDGYKELHKLSDNELADYFNTKEPSKAREKLSSFETRAKEIKKRYDYFEEKFPNPFNPKNFKQGSDEQLNEYIAYKGFEEAKKAAIFSQHAFDRSLERMVGIYDDLLKDSPLRKASQTDYAVMVNPENIKNEVKLLKQEADLLKQSDDAEDRKMGEQKMKKAEILEEYNNKYNSYVETKEKVNKAKRASGTIDEELQNELYERTDSLKESYAKYLSAIADEKSDYLFDDNVVNSFKKVLDHYDLKDDARMHMANVNYLTNPDNLIRHAQRISAVLKEMHDNRESLHQEGIKNFFNVAELNGFIDSLGAIGIMVDPQQLIELYQNGTVPTKFIDPKTGKEISENDPRVAAVQGILDTYIRFKNATNNLYKEEETTGQPEEQPEQQPEEQPEEEPKEEEGALSKDVQSKLQEAYDNFIDETGSDMSFDDFVATHPTAARIKSEMKGAEPAQQAAPVSDAAEKDDVERRRQKEIDSITPIKSEDVTIDGGDSFDFTLTFRVITFKDGSTIIRHIKSGDTVADGKSKKLNNYPTFNDFNNFFAEDLINSKGIIKTELIKDNYTDKQSQETQAAKEKTINAKYDAELEALGKTTSTAPVSDIEAKKADIEDRRKSAIKRLAQSSDGSWSSNVMLDRGNGKTEAGKATDWFVDLGKDKTKAIEQINAKYDAELAALEGKPTQGTTDVITPIESPKVVITGTRSGMENLGNPDVKKTDYEGVKDARGRDFDENGVLTETDKDGNTIMHIKVDAKDNVGRKGFLQASITIPKGSKIDEVKIKEIVSRNIETMKKNNSDLILDKVDPSMFTNMRNEIINELKNPTPTAPVSDIVPVYHHTVVKPTDFNFGTFQRGRDQISQFGDGLNASSTTTPFLVQRYGNPIEGEVRDSDFVVIDANKSEKDLYNELKSKGYKFNNPATGSYIGNDPAKEYNGTEKANEQPAIISLFNDFQKSNPEVKGVKVVNHIIGNQKVDPFYVIYDAKSFYGPGSLSKKVPTVTPTQAAPISNERESEIRKVYSRYDEAKKNEEYFIKKGQNLDNLSEEEKEILKDPVAFLENEKNYYERFINNIKSKLLPQLEAEKEKLLADREKYREGEFNEKLEKLNTKIDAAKNNIKTYTESIKSIPDTIAKIKKINEKYSTTSTQAASGQQGVSGIQTNPQAIGANGPIIIVDDLSERPDIFEEWIDPQIVAGDEVHKMLVLKHVQDIYNFGQKLDKEGAPWTIGSFRAQVAGRLIVDVFAGGKRFLMYKSTGLGTGAESKGEWTPLFGFAQNGWFIKTMWNGENPKFNKYESETFKAIDLYLKGNEDALFAEPKGPLTQREQIAQEKINKVLSGITSLKDSPDKNLNNMSKASKELLNLIATGEITSDEAEAAAKQKYQELLNKLQPSDFTKGDIVIFNNGRKGIVQESSKDGIYMKMFDAPGSIEKIEASKLKTMVADIKTSKQAIQDQQTEPVVDVTPEDEISMKQSQQATDDLATDSQRASSAINEGMNNATDEPSGFDDLFLGCDNII